MKMESLQNNNSDKKFIDLEQVIRDKNPGLLKVLPTFILNFIRKVIHEKQINDFIKENGNKHDFDFLSCVLKEFDVKIKVIGKENIPQKGGFIFAGNHPLGGLDGIAFMKAVGEVRKDIKFLVNDILLNLENIKSLFIPVNKSGRNSSEIIDTIEKTCASDHAILIFPAGLVSRKQGKEIKDLEWKKSFVALSKKYQKDIIPVYIEGRNTNFFYNLARWRKAIGIKANLEMFFLVDEMYKQRSKTIILCFGKLISYKSFDNTSTDKQWANKIKEQVYFLKKEL